MEPCTAKPVTLTAAEAAALLTLLKRVINAWHLQRANYREIFVILDKLGDGRKYPVSYLTPRVEWRST
jgi:hypothetical protein